MQVGVREDVLMVRETENKLAIGMAGSLSQGAKGSRFLNRYCHRFRHPVAELAGQATTSLGAGVLVEHSQPHFPIYL